MNGRNEPAETNTGTYIILLQKSDIFPAGARPGVCATTGRPIAIFNDREQAARAQAKLMADDMKWQAAWRGIRWETAP